MFILYNCAFACFGTIHLVTFCTCVITDHNTKKSLPQFFVLLVEQLICKVNFKMAYPFPHSINFSSSSNFFLSSSFFFAFSTVKSRFLPSLSRCTVSAPSPVAEELILENISVSLLFVTWFSLLSSAPECKPALRTKEKQDAN